VKEKDSFFRSFVSTYLLTNFCNFVLGNKIDFCVIFSET
jgi:hypothetical protein